MNKRTEMIRTRVTPAEVEQLEAIRASIQSGAPAGMQITQSDALRYCIQVAHRGIEQATRYTNISERYGDPVEVSMQDYLDLEPEAEFQVRHDGIYEVLSDETIDKIADATPA